jgi:hypothetical protein
MSTAKVWQQVVSSKYLDLSQEEINGRNSHEKSRLNQIDGKLAVIVSEDSHQVKNQ